jgi:hypothetical protein
MVAATIGKVIRVLKVVMEDTNETQPSFIVQFSVRVHISSHLDDWHHTFVEYVLSGYYMNKL